MFSQKEIPLSEGKEPENEKPNQNYPPWSSISFACGGWLQFYLFGVVKAIQDAGVEKGVTYCGCSAGALAAAGALLGANPDIAIEYCKERCLQEAYSNTWGLFRLKEYVSACFDLCIGPNFHKLQEGALQIAITKLPFFKPERISNFKSVHELKQTLLASCAAVPFSPIIKLKGSWYIDGGLSDFQPILNQETITVSPFYFSDCDIKPSRYVPLWWTFLPPKCGETVDWLYKLGWEDGMKYFEMRGIKVDPSIWDKAASTAKLSELDQGGHPYNVPRRISMHRFLGYDLRQITHEYVYFVMDFLLLILLVLFWKPLALCLIYIELFIRIIYLSIIFIAQYLWLQSTPHLATEILTSVSIRLTNSSHPDNSTMKSSQIAHNQKNMTRHKPTVSTELWETITCVWSLSLFLRFLSGRPSSIELKKHNRLKKASLLYRVFRHII